ncbi:hypothetical protein S83_001064 [Arachis hypogaea]
MTNVLSSTDVITHFITTITLRPEELLLELKHSFKIVVADPPYLMVGSSNTLIWYSRFLPSAKFLNPGVSVKDC